MTQEIAAILFLFLFSPFPGTPEVGTYGENDAGQIVGYGFLNNGTTREAFLLMPVVPEPSATALCCIVAMVLALRRQRS